MTLNKEFVNWDNGSQIEYGKAKLLAQEAEELAKGLAIATTETRSWYEDTYQATVIDYFKLAQLIERVRKQERQKYDEYKKADTTYRETFGK